MEREGSEVGEKRRRGSVEMHGLFGCCLALWVRIPESDATTATTQRAGASSTLVPRDRHEAHLAPTSYLASVPSAASSQTLCKLIEHEL